MSVNVLNAITGDLIASNIVATTNHNYYFGAIVNYWFDLFGYPAGTFVVKSTIVLPLKLFAGEFEEDALIHSTSVAEFRHENRRVFRRVTVMWIFPIY